jgi:hypothetical protein
MDTGRYVLMVRFAGFQKRLWPTEQIAVIDRQTHEEIGSLTGEAILAMIRHHVATALLQATLSAEFRRPPMVMPSRTAAHELDDTPVTPETRARFRARREPRRRPS